MVSKINSVCITGANVCQQMMYLCYSSFFTMFSEESECSCSRLLLQMQSESHCSDLVRVNPFILLFQHSEQHCLLSYYRFRMGKAFNFKCRLVFLYEMFLLILFCSRTESPSAVKVAMKSILRTYSLRTLNAFQELGKHLN